MKRGNLDQFRNFLSGDGNIPIANDEEAILFLGPIRGVSSKSLTLEVKGAFKVYGAGVSLPSRRADVIAAHIDEIEITLQAIRATQFGVLNRAELEQLETGEESLGIFGQILRRQRDFSESVLLSVC